MGRSGKVWGGVVRCGEERYVWGGVGIKVVVLFSHHYFLSSLRTETVWPQLSIARRH